MPNLFNKSAHIFPGDGTDTNWQKRLRHHRVLLRRMSKKIQCVRSQLAQRYLDHLREIDARLHFVHPSEGVIMLKWYDEICIPLCKEDDKRAIILNLNGFLCHVIETQYDDIDPPYSNELVKYPINKYGYVLCHKDAHKFLDWCIQFFDVFIWSACRRPKLSRIIDVVFPQQKLKFAGVLSQEHCSKAKWLVQNRQVFFKNLHTFWGLHPSYNKKNTLILDDSYYKVFENEQGTWLIVPPLHHQTMEERYSFLIEELTNWLFLWLQNEDRQEYTCDNAFEETPDEFSDDVMKKWYKESILEQENRQKAEIWKRQEEADAEAERQAQNENQRKQ